MKVGDGLKGYVSADLSMDNVDLNIDLTQIPFPNSTFFLLQKKSVLTRKYNNGQVRSLRRACRHGLAGQTVVNTLEDVWSYRAFRACPHRKCGSCGCAPLMDVSSSEVPSWRRIHGERADVR
jgi:hypothetical protein